jgi:ribosomal protein L32
LALFRGRTREPTTSALARPALPAAAAASMTRLAGISRALGLLSIRTRTAAASAAAATAATTTTTTSTSTRAAWTAAAWTATPPLPVAPSSLPPHLPPPPRAPRERDDTSSGGDRPYDGDGQAPPPVTCGEPKNKLSVHRRGHRRTAYHLKRRPLFARCPHCGGVGAPHELLLRAGACTGGCLPEAGSRTYRPEYKAPV